MIKSKKRLSQSEILPYLDEYKDQHLDVVNKYLGTNKEKIAKLAELIKRSFSQDYKLLLCGNGGSAADAQHAAAEFVGRMTIERPALPAIALTTDTSALTAISNDYGYTHVFSRQVEALGNHGDVIIGISTSGNSANVFSALATSKDLGLHTIALVGSDPKCKVAQASDTVLSVPSFYTPHVQECHLMTLHLLAELVDRID